MNKLKIVSFCFILLVSIGVIMSTVKTIDEYGMNYVVETKINGETLIQEINNMNSVIFSTLLLLNTVIIGYFLFSTNNN